MNTILDTIVNIDFEQVTKISMYWGDGELSNVVIKDKISNTPEDLKWEAILVASNLFRYDNTAYAIAE